MNATVSIGLQERRRAAARSGERLTLLLLTHRSPHAPNRGDRIRSHHMLRVLARHHDVHVLTLVHDEEEAAAAAQLRQLAASVTVARVNRIRNYGRATIALLGSRPLTHVLLDAGEMPALLSQMTARADFDAVLSYCSGMARFALEPPLDRLPLILDMVDVDSRKWAALGERTRGPLGWIYRREAAVMSQFEARAAERAVYTTVVNARERDSLVDIAPRSRVRVVPNGIDLRAFMPAGPPSAEPRVVFTGVFNYAPNEEGAIWMAREVWPLVRAQRSDARLVLVGASPTAAIRRLAQQDSSIEVTGTVPSVQPYLWNAAVAVVPLATARGVQNKALEAIAAGLPVVVTPIVREGLPAAVEPACVVAVEPQTFAAAVLSLLRLAPAARRRMAQEARLAPLEWPAQLRPLLDLLASLPAATDPSATGPIRMPS